MGYGEDNVTCPSIGLYFTASTKVMQAESDQNSWNCVAITLDPESDRYQSFLHNNDHLKIQTFYGITGKSLSTNEIISKGLATQELLDSGLATPGALGCAASHRSVWQKASKEGKGYFVLEDDSHTHPKVEEFIKANLSTLMASDICFFGINTDSILHSISPYGLTSLGVFYPEHPSPEWIRNALSKTNIQEVSMHRLLKAFGFHAYFVSPAGASRLCDKIFPLSTRTTQIPLMTSDFVYANGIDSAANGFYSQIQAFICNPFLAYASNVESTTRD